MKLGTATRLACVAAGQQIPNEDPETGIHYGVINSNDELLNPCWVDGIMDGKDLGFERQKADAIDNAVKAIMDLTSGACSGDNHDFGTLRKELMENEDICVHVNRTADDMLEASWAIDEGEAKQIAENNFDDERFSNEMLSDGRDTTYRYEQDGYIIDLNTGDSDLFVIKSPYYTLRGYCSPCAPNACFLKTAGEEKTYCLGADWFESEKAPYPIFSVETGKESQ